MQKEKLNINATHGISKMQHVRNVLGRTPEWLKSIFYTDAYIGFYIVCTMMSWLLDRPEIGLTMFGVCGAISLLVVDDITVQLPHLFYLVGNFVAQDAMEYVRRPTGPYIGLMFGIYVLALILQFIIYKPVLRVRKMVVPYLLLEVAMLLSIAFEDFDNKIPQDVGRNVLDMEMWATYITLVAAPLAFYLGSAYAKPNKYVDKRRYIAKFVVGYGMIGSFMVIFTFFFGNAANNYSYSLFKDLINGGAASSVPEPTYGVGNNAAIAYILVMSFPLGFYLDLNKQKGIRYYTLCSYITFISIFLAFSRAEILLAVLIVPVIVIAILKHSNNKLAQLRPAIILATITIICCLIWYDVVYDLVLASITQKGNGREKLYNDALRQFRINPWTGRGVAFKEFFGWREKMWQYHSTFFQVIGAMGLVGLVAYSIFYVVQYKIVFKNINKDPYKVFIMLAMMGIEFVGLIDCPIFIAYPYMCFMAVYVVECETQNNIKFDQIPENQRIVYSR